MKDIDFVRSNLKDLVVIVRPTNTTKNEAGSSKISHIHIQKSFKPEIKSEIHDAIRPQVQDLKNFLKRKEDEERRKRILRKQHEMESETIEEVKQVQEKEKVVIDESGQVRDEHGNLIFVKNRTTELMINKKKEQETQVKQLQQKKRMKFHKRLGKNLLDRNLIVGSVKKRIRKNILGLRFLQKGSYQVKETVLKSESRQEILDLNQIIREPVFRTIKKRNKAHLKFDKQIPRLQWWDQQILKVSDYNQIDVEQFKKDISKFIKIENITDEVRYQRVGESKSQNQKDVLPMYLTKEEKKKLKRKKKHIKLLQKNDKVKLGLIEPEKPKLRVGNMAIVLKNEFILDPSKVQAEAKKQMQERLDKHLIENQERKLTKKQKKQKRIRKKMRDSAKQVRRAVFRLNKLDDPSECFKVSVNATHNFLSGLTIKPSIAGSQPVLIVVEGGPKDVKDYKKLMLKRINWTKNDPLNSCQLLWQGTISQRSCGKWRTYEVDDQVEAIRILDEKKLQYFSSFLTNQ